MSDELISPDLPPERRSLKRTLPDHVKRNRRVVIMVNARELELLYDEAVRRECSMSEFAREAMLELAR